MHTFIIRYLKGILVDYDLLIYPLMAIFIFLGFLSVLFGTLTLGQSPPEALGYIAIGIGILAVLVSLWADKRVNHALDEIKRAEIDEKIAVMHLILENQDGRIISDLLSLERSSPPATKIQIAQIEETGRNLLGMMHERSSSREDDARVILNRILGRFGRVI